MCKMTTIVVAFAITSLVAAVAGTSAAEKPDVTPQSITRPDSKAPDHSKPVKVFILMGQSNMVGMGDISGGSIAWAPAVQKPVLSVYEGEYSNSADYDKMTAASTLEVPNLGAMKAPTFTGARTCVLRGQLQMKTAMRCEFSPGYGGSSYNIMVIDGTEVYRREVGKEPIRKPFAFEEGKAYSFKITYLTREVGGSGWYQNIDVPGALETLVKKQKKYPFLIDDAGQWTIRKDVYYYDARVKKGSPLSATSNGKSIGPELGFGCVMGQVLDEPVLVLKSCIGNRSLGWDLLPPGSERYQAEVTERDGKKVTKTFAGYKDTPDSWIEGQPKKEVNWYAGKQYDDDMANAKAALADLSKIYPDYKGQGYEIAGFVWWQGHKDQNEVHAARYEQNLKRLIAALRKDYDAPKAKFVLATGCGNPGREGFGLQIAEAQLAIADSKKHAEFAGNVKAVDSRDLWREVDVSPKSQGYHYNRNAETYMEVGLRLGWAMAELLK